MTNLSSPPHPFFRAYATLAKLASCLQSPILLLMRLYWGWQFFQAGKGKLMDLDTPTKFFTKLNIPFPHLSAIMAGSTECFGGLLLLVGLGSRLFTIPLIFTMAVAYLTADIDKVKNIFNDGDAFVSATPFQFMLTAVIVFAFGPGCFSLDALIGYLLRKSNPQAFGTTNCATPRPPGIV
jgi:putative oxidoreductase